MTDLISIEDFQKIELKTAEVLKAEKVEGSEKLLKLTVKIGEEQRTIVAGISKYYGKEIEGKTIIVVANLKPRSLKGIESQGMLLAVSDDSGLSILTTDKPAKSGIIIK
jgi:methionine--tRNA ligase beta chain